MTQTRIDGLAAEISALNALHTVGRVVSVQGATLRVSGLSSAACIGDRIRIHARDGRPRSGEVLQLDEASVLVLPDEPAEGLALGDRVSLLGASTIAPSQDWIGRVIDPYGQPLDDRPLMRGPRARPVRADPPSPARRRPLGARLETGMAAFNTFLPIVSGQRMGVFAGSGVGKSMLLGQLARNMQADLVVIALIGERGRELSDFIREVLGPEGMKRAVIVAATSDRSPLVRRRCAWTAMAVAEHFRDQGQHVLFLADSITRFAEAHREIAVSAGEMPALRGYPASTAPAIMSLCERAGPGESLAGDITALLTVLVAGSDMDEPVADILRGVLDGHVVLDRQIAERGRYPAIDVLRSVSRSLPGALDTEENALVSEARRYLGSYARAETMIRAGLHVEGNDTTLDQAIRLWPEIDGFLGETEAGSSRNSFARLSVIMRRAGAGSKMSGRSKRS